MNYPDTLDYLFSQLPMYQRIGAAAYKADLNTTWQLLEAMGNPHNSGVKYIHVAGTNGKGSVSHMISSVLQSAGFKCGLFTSPHLRDFRERIKVNGEMIGKEAVISFVEENKETFAAIEPSFFEMTAALAFQYFKEQQVDFAILETGMGGRLDSTNVMTPEVAVITNIGLDHIQFLGNTIKAIAGEKAGIIKQNRPVIAGPMLPEAYDVIRQKAEEMSSDFHNASGITQTYPTDLHGYYQRENQQTALCAINVLRQLGHTIPDEAIETGMQNVIAQTGLLGRWQTLSENPKIICDVGHNTDGLRQVVKQLDEMTFNRLHIVLGMVNDKNAEEALRLLPSTATYYFCAAKIPRAMDVQQLHTIAQAVGLAGKTYNGVEEALNAAKENAAQDDLIFVGGSVFVVAEVV